MGRQIRNLGQCAKYGLLVRAQCDCGRHADFSGHDLCGMYGWDRPIESLKFRCAVCDKPVKRIYPYKPEPSAPPEYVWRRVRKE